MRPEAIPLVATVPVDGVESSVPPTLGVAGGNFAAFGGEAIGGAALICVVRPLSPLFRVPPALQS